MDSPRALAERSDVIVTMLFDAPALEAVFHGPDRLIAAAQNRLFIEMSTVRPTCLVELFADTSGGPGVLKGRGPAIAAALADSNPGPASFDIDAIRKNITTVVAEASDRGFAIPVATEALAAFDGASEAGWGPRDCV